MAKVYDNKALTFYRKHAVRLIDAAWEAHEEVGKASLLITILLALFV